jgi:hypothetical protein
MWALNAQSRGHSTVRLRLLVLPLLFAVLALDFDFAAGSGLA